MVGMPANCFIVTVHTPLPFHQALDLSERLMGLNHPMTANRLHNLASLYEDLGRGEEAVGMYTRALAVKDKVWEQ